MFFPFFPSLCLPLSVSVSVSLCVYYYLIKFFVHYTVSFRFIHGTNVPKKYVKALTVRDGSVWPEWSQSQSLAVLTNMQYKYLRIRLDNEDGFVNLAI